MTDLVPRPNEPKQEEGQASPAALPLNMEETLHLDDLELMMHWCTTTYRSMARDHEAESLWQTVIPQLSLRHLPLRHGLLAMSALQLGSASTSPSCKWRLLLSAREHQSQALEGIPCDGTQDLTTAECNALYALCSVLLAFTFAYCIVDDDMQGDDSEQRPDTLDEFLEVFEFTRWLVSAMMMVMDRVAGGDLHSLVRHETTRPTMPDMSRLVVLALRRQNEAEAEQDSSHEREVYDQAIEHLRTALEHLMNGGEPKDYAFCWAFRIPGRYQDLLREREPFSLVVLAHYAVILHHLRDSWWMGDWGMRILREVDINLEPEYRHLISWPIDATGGYFLLEE